MAIPLKRQLINVDKLAFPTGTATAETLRSLHSTGAKAMQQAKTLIYCGLVGAVVKFWQEGLRSALDLRLGQASVGMVQGLGLHHAARNAPDVSRRSGAPLAEALRVGLRAFDALHRRRRHHGHPRRRLDAGRGRHVLRRSRPADGPLGHPRLRDQEGLRRRRRLDALAGRGPDGHRRLDQFRHAMADDRPCHGRNHGDFRQAPRPVGLRPRRNAHDVVRARLGASPGWDASFSATPFSASSGGWASWPSS